MKIRFHLFIKPSVNIEIKPGPSMICESPGPAMSTVVWSILLLSYNNMSIKKSIRLCNNSCEPYIIIHDNLKIIPNNSSMQINNSGLLRYRLMPKSYRETSSWDVAHEGGRSWVWIQVLQRSRQVSPLDHPAACNSTWSKIANLDLLRPPLTLSKRNKSWKHSFERIPQTLFPSWKAKFQCITFAALIFAIVPLIPE